MHEDILKKELIRFIEKYDDFTLSDDLGEVIDELIAKLEEVKLLNSMALFEVVMMKMNELINSFGKYFPDSKWSEVDKYIRNNKIIHAIKEYRAKTGDSLIDSKRAVEKRRDEIQKYIKT